MKALVFKGPWEIVVEDREIRSPGPGEALVRVIATGVCGSDLHGYTGHTGRRHPEQVMGHETVGRVEELGADTAGVAIGAVVVINPAMSCGACAACSAREEQRCENLRVIGVVPDWDAAFAEYMIAPVANLLPLPHGTPEHLGALVEPLAVGWHAVRRARLQAGESIFVIGGGPIGQAVALAAQRAGVSDILVSESLPSRRQLLESLGFMAVAPDAATDLLAQRTVGTVFDAVGSSDSVAQGLLATGRGGRLVLIGMADPQLTVSAFEVSVREREIIGTFCYSNDDFASTVQWLADNIDTVTKLVDIIEPLESGPTVFKELASYSRDASKILLAPGVS